jgi:hypothetical protein
MMQANQHFAQIALVVHHLVPSFSGVGLANRCFTAQDLSAAGLEVT